jgi:hypothetical protein
VGNLQNILTAEIRKMPNMILREIVSRKLKEARIVADDVLIDRLVVNIWNAD